MHPNRRCGFSLLEVMVAIAILGISTAVITQSLSAGTAMTQQVSLQTDINDRANSVLNQLALELRTASGASTQLKIPNASASTPTIAVYSYAVSTGITMTGTGATASWTTTYEPTLRSLTYDSVAGTLVKTWYDSAGNRNDVQLCEGIIPPTTVGLVPHPGFSITQVGTTLQMSLALQTQTRIGSVLVYTAQAQVLFMRSTLNASTGSSPVTNLADPVDTNGVLPGTTTAAPSLSFSNLVTLLGSGQQQVAIVIAPPVGQQVDPTAMDIQVLATPGTTYTPLIENVAVTTNPDNATLTQNTLISTDGTLTVTLTGTVSGPIQIKVTAASTSGVSVTDNKSY